MGTIKMYEEVNHHCRCFFGTAAGTIAATQLGMMGLADAQPSKTKLPAVTPGANTSFGSLKQMNAGLSTVGYVEVGPAAGPPHLQCTAPITSAIKGEIRSAAIIH